MSLENGRWSISSAAGLSRIDERGRLMENDVERDMGMNLDELTSESDGDAHYHHTKNDSYEESQPLKSEGG